MDLPFAGLRIIDTGRGEQRVEIVVGGEPVALLPVFSVAYKMTIRGPGEIQVGVHSQHVEMTGGDGEALS